MHEDPHYSITVVKEKFGVHLNAPKCRNGWMYDEDSLLCGSQGSCKW